MGCGLGTSKEDKKKDSQKHVSRIKNEDTAQLDLQVQIRRAKDHRQKLENRVSSFKTEALKWKKDGNKQKALFALKMKKLTESGLDKVDGVIVLLEKTLQELQEARMTADVHDVLKKGNAAIKELQASATLESFEQIYDDMQERQKANEELAVIVGDTGAEDAAYEEELEELEKRMESAGAESATLNIPSPPKDKIGVEKEKAKAVEKAAVLA